MFDDFELSQRAGRPRQLFVFGRQSLALRYTNNGRDVVIGGKTYLAAAIARSEIKLTVESPQDKITVTIPYTRNPDAAELPVTQPLGDLCYPYVPQDRISVMCMDYHAKDPDLQAVLRWQGRVSQPVYNHEEGTLELTCVRNGTGDRSRRRGPKWQKTCWKTVYSTGLRGCLLDPADFTTAGTVTAVNGLVVSAAEFATAAFSLAGGTFTWTRTDGIEESRPIMAHTKGSTDVTLLYGGKDLAVDLAVTALPNCPGTWQACTDRNNTIHYGGSVYEPIQSPYSGESMSWDAPTTGNVDSGARIGTGTGSGGVG
jgi:hypothetical protein